MLALQRLAGTRVSHRSVTQTYHRLSPIYPQLAVPIRDKQAYALG